MQNSRTTASLFSVPLRLLSTPILLGLAAATLVPPGPSAPGDQIAKLQDLNGSAFGEFGSSTATDGVLVVVGSPGATNNGTAVGAAFVYDAITGALLTKYIAPDGVTKDDLGQSVAIDGTTAIVGPNAVFDTTGAFESAYLFNPLTGATLAKLEALDGSSQDSFGYAVGISGSTAIVGAYRHDDNGINSGAAYLFDVPTAQQLTELLPADGATNDNFGFSVAIDGTTAVIGAPQDDDNGDRTGSVYVFDTVTGNQTAKLLALDAQDVDELGYSVAVSGMVAIAGAPFSDDSGTSSGSAYLFDTTTGEQLAKLVSLDSAAGDQFGLSVAISGTTAIVGALGHADNGIASGAAYLFDVPTGAQLAKLLPLDGMAGYNFGASVAIAGATALIGSPNDDGLGNDAGSAYLFDGTNPAVPASATVRNGSGLNALLLNSRTDPILGTDWEADLDATGHAPALVLLALFDQPSSGIFIPAGEILFDLTSTMLSGVVQAHASDLQRISVSIPLDASLFGFSATSQGAILGSPGLELTNAVDLIAGS